MGIKNFFLDKISNCVFNKLKKDDKKHFKKTLKLELSNIPNLKISTEYGGAELDIKKVEGFVDLNLHIPSTLDSQINFDDALNNFLEMLSLKNMELKITTVEDFN